MCYFCVIYNFFFFFLLRVVCLSVFFFLMSKIWFCIEDKDFISGSCSLTGSNYR